MRHPQKILVFRQSSLGDVILTLPVIRTLSESFPEAAIDYLTKAPYEQIIKHNPAIRNVLTFNNNADFKRLLSSLRQEKYDLIIDLQANLRSLALAACCFSAKRIKYKKRRLAREMIARKPGLKLKVDHTVNAYFHSLRRLGIKSDPAPPKIYLPDEFREYSEEFFAKSFSGACDKIIALCPGARHFEKKWPHEKFRAVAETILKDENTGILIISASSDDVPADLELKHQRVAFVSDLEILQIAAILSKCGAALTNDSGLMHLANAAGVKVVAIFGPTSPRLGFSPALPGSRIISNDVFCSPCSVHGQKPCRQPRKYCFENITPDQAAGALEEICNS